MSDHNKCPSSEKEHEKCIFGLSYFHRIQPNHSTHGSDQCGYIHLLYRFIIWFTVVEVGDLCRLGWQGQARDGYLRLTIGYLKATVFTLG